MVEIQLVDRSLMIAALNREIKIVPSSTAIVAIDMHRGHLDMSVATMPTTPKMLSASSATLKNCSRMRDHWVCRSST